MGYLRRYSGNTCFPDISAIETAPILGWRIEWAVSEAIGRDERRVRERSGALLGDVRGFVAKCN